MYFATDDTVVSELGTFTNPILFTLRADLEETDSIRMYAECDTGYQATDVDVTIEGTGAAKWSLASDTTGSPGTYSAGPLVLGSVGAGSANRVYFWIKAIVTNDEGIGVDNSVTFKLEGIGSAV